MSFHAHWTLHGQWHAVRLLMLGALGKGSPSCTITPNRVLRLGSNADALQLALMHDAAVTCPLAAPWLLVQVGAQYPSLP